MTSRLSEFDIDLLLTLDALLETQNVSRAAEKLNITQSALSARLIRLRLLLNDTLFTPASSGRGMTPTPHAVYLQPELKRLLERLNDFINVAHLFNPTSTKRVFRIAATDNPAAILAPDLIPAFEAQAPAGKFAFTVPDKLRIVELLESGEVDLFIGAAEDGSDGLIGQKLFEEEFITAQRRGHPRGSGPLSLDEFCNLNHLLVSTSGGKFSGLIDDVLAELGRERNVSVSIQSYALAPLMLSSTDLICTLPRRFLERFSAILELTETPFPIAPFSMNIFWHPRSRTDPAHLWFRKLVMHSGRGHAVPTATI